LFPPRDRGCIVAAMHPFLPFTNDEEYRRLFSSSQSEIENRFHLNAGGAGPFEHCFRVRPEARDGWKL